MPAPRPARSLDVLLREVNAHAPARSRASDGWIGDAAHQSRPSDHNPDPVTGVVRARDITHDPDGGLNCNELATLLLRKLGKLPALGPGAYLIWNGRIVSTNRLGEGWRAYTGSNPHRSHLHVSVASSSSGYDSALPWQLWPARTPQLDGATAELTRARHRLEVARDARNPGPVRRSIRTALQSTRAALQAIRLARRGGQR